MKRRSKQNSAYWERRLEKLMTSIPDSHKVKNRYRSLYALLIEKYPTIINSDKKETVHDFLKDICYMDRMLRRATSGEEEEEKQILSQEFQMDVLDYDPNYQQDLNKLESL